MRYMIAVILMLATACAHKPTARDRYELGIEVGYVLMENGPENIDKADPYAVGVLRGVLRWGTDQTLKMQREKLRAVIDEARAEREEKARGPIFPKELGEVPVDDLTP